MLVNFAAGGLTDIEGRLVAKYLPRFIPGNPAAIVNNMPGAGVNYRNELSRRVW